MARLPRHRLSSSRYPRQCRLTAPLRGRLRRAWTRLPLTRGSRLSGRTGKSSSPWRASATIASTVTDLLPVVASVLGGLGPQRVRNHNRGGGDRFDPGWSGADRHYARDQPLRTNPKLARLETRVSGQHPKFGGSRGWPPEGSRCYAFALCSWGGAGDGRAGRRDGSSRAAHLRAFQATRR